MKKFFKGSMTLAFMLAVSVPAMALEETAIDAIKTKISSGLTDVAAISVSVFGVLAGIWGIRKVVKLLNRS